MTSSFIKILLIWFPLLWKISFMFIYLITIHSSRSNFNASLFMKTFLTTPVRGNYTFPCLPRYIITNSIFYFVLLFLFFHICNISKHFRKFVRRIITCTYFYFTIWQSITFIDQRNYMSFLVSKKKKVPKRQHNSFWLFQ